MESWEIWAIVSFLVAVVAFNYFVFWILPRWMSRRMDRVSNRPAKAILGGLLMLCGIGLWGIILAGIGTHCEHPGWQKFLLVIGGWCVLATGWRPIADALDLPKRGG